MSLFLLCVGVSLKTFLFQQVLPGAGEMKLDVGPFAKALEVTVPFPGATHGTNVCLYIQCTDYVV